MKMGKPKFVLSKSRVLEQYRKVEKLADLVSYSSKTNQHITPILEHETWCMFSVHFENELKHVKDKSRVVFLAQAWGDKEIERLLGMGVKWFVVDNEPDLDELLSALESWKGKVSILLRARLREHTLSTERYFVFGMGSETVNKRIRELRGHGKIEKLGVHFHRKTQNLSEWNLRYELENMLEKDVLKAIDVVDMGGGLPAQYANTNVDVLPGIFGKVREFREWLNSKGVQLVIEPGRFIAAPAIKLVTEVAAVHGNTIVVNASVYNSDLDALIVPVKLLVEDELSKKDGRPFVVKGITPCSLDLFRYRVYLNAPKKGDKLVFLNAGAYNFHTDFCDLGEIETETVA